MSGKSVFGWHMPCTIKKLSHSITKIESKFWHMTHKFSLNTPKYIENSLQYDSENDNTIWLDTILNETKNTRVAFEEFEINLSDLPPGYQ